MKEQFINEIQRKMLPYLNNEQLVKLKNILIESVQGLTICDDGNGQQLEELDAVKVFIGAKSIEG